jgi:gliding motility-associated-like protein
MLTPTNLRYFFLLLFCSTSLFVSSQTFPGQGGLPFPPIGDIGITESPATVSGVGILGGCVKIDNVTVNLNHTWDGDIALMLIAPNGTFIELSSANGGPNDNYTNTVFKDNAPTNIVTGSAPFTGNFKPEGRQNTNLNNPYSNAGAAGTFTFQNTFDGINADGDWILYLNDFVVGDVGFLNSWSITFSNNGVSFTVNAGPNLQKCAGDQVTLTATNTAPNPSAYLWSNGATTQTIDFLADQTSTFGVTVTDASGCTQIDAVEVTVSPRPIGNPVTYLECESTPVGNADFFLNTVALPIGNGLPVTFFSDITLINQISGIALYNSPSTVVYAVVTQGNCSSVPVPITLQVLITNPAAFSMNIVEDFRCGPGTIEPQFVLPVPAMYRYQYQLVCEGGTTTNTITTEFSSFPLFVDSDCTLNILSITNILTNCVTVFNPPLTDDIDVDPLPLIEADPIQVCEGQSIDLADFVTADPGATLTFHTESPATPANQLPSSVVTPGPTDTYVASAELDACTFDLLVPITILTGGISFNSSTNLCENSPPINLTPFVTPTTLAGTWSGQGVNGNLFDPEGLSGTVTLTYAPTASSCYDPGTLTITVTPDQTLDLLTSDICSSSQPLDLNTLEDTDVTMGVWSGTGVSSNFFDPTQASGTVTLTFTPSDNCISAATTSVSVLPQPTPNLAGNIIVCQGVVVELSDYVINPQGNQINYYSALPAIAANEITNTAVTVNSTTQFYVKVTDANGCFGIATLEINTTAGGVPVLGSATVCQSENAYNLDLLNDGLVGSGIWSGQGVVSNILTLSNQSGTVNLTFVPDNTCFTDASTSVVILQPSTPILDAESLCSASGAYNLSSLLDPDYPIGLWAGQGVTGNVFDPSNLSGLINITFDPTQYCVNTANTQINVTASATPTLASLTVCETTDLIDLNTLEDPNYTNGIWSGVGVDNSTFTTSGLQGNNSITFTSPQNCVLPATTSITINNLQQPQLQSASICDNATPIDLGTLTDPILAIGSWSGIGVTNGFFDPNGISGNVILTFTPNALCTQAATTEIAVNASPTVSNITSICDQSNTYSVQFNITGGDQTAYFVNGLPASGNFISANIPSQTPYNFSVSDINLCQTIAVQGNKNCACIADAGSMNFSNAPLKICKSDIAVATYNGNAIKEINDKLVFILHDNPGPSKGNILGISNTPFFAFSSNLVLNTEYYISVAIGDSIDINQIDFDDACFSISAGVPVIFYEPAISIDDVKDFCSTDCSQIKVDMAGEGPYSVVLGFFSGNNFISSDTFSSPISNFERTFCPSDFNIGSGELNVKILDYSDRNCVGKLPDEGTRFNVLKQRNNGIQQTLCEGEQFTINGKVYNELKPTGRDTIPSTSSTQCDSIITVSLNFVRPSTFNFTKQICETQGEVINGKRYDVNNPSGKDTIIGGNINGCDSIIIVNLTFTNEIRTEIKAELCAGDSLVVNGKIFKQSSTEIIPSKDNIQCDSVITVTLTFIAPRTSDATDILCDGEFKIINNNRYDKNKSSGQETIFGGSANGCDSIITVNLSFLPPATSQFDATVCDGETFEFYGQLFDKNRTSDTIKINNGSANGCDSIITVNLSFLPPATSQFNATVCDGETFEFYGQLFDKNRTYDTIKINNGSMNGCDSLITVNLFFYPIEIDTVSFDIGREESITYNGVVFDNNNRSKLTTDLISNGNGCDSYTFVRVNIKQEFITANYELISETCPGKNDGTITIQDINGCEKYSVSFGDSVVIDPQMPLTFDSLRSGQYVLTITSDGGCIFIDTVTINPSFSEDFTVQTDVFVVEEGSHIILDPVISPTPKTISWSPADFLNCEDCLSPEISATSQDLTYTIYLTDDQGCIYTRQINVDVKERDVEIVVPNIFSPNGDGRNDTWDINLYNSEIVEELSIYDRWGNLVFITKPSSDQSTVSWDGKMNGQGILSGVYVYKLTLNEGPGKIKYLSGDITVTY